MTMDFGQRNLKHLVRKGLRSFGWDMIRYPGSTPYVEHLALQRHLGDVFSTRAINCVIDAGAHHGQYGEMLRSIGYAGRIVSFEPVPASFAALKERSSADRQWKAHCLALGDRDATLGIHVFSNTDFSSFLEPNDYGHEFMDDKTRMNRCEAVPMKRLDSVFDECISGIRDPKVFLKMDTQGYDLMILNASALALSKVLGIQSEVSVIALYKGMTGYLSAIAQMNQLGFDLTGLFPVTRDRRLRVIELDCVMMREAG